MDELVATPTLATAVEKARNRLGIALFAVCLGVVAIWILVDQPSKIRERQLADISKQYQYWTAVELRRIRLEENPRSFFYAALNDMLLSTCVSNAEFERLQSQYSSEMQAIERGYGSGHTNVDSAYVERHKRCPAGHRRFDTTHSDLGWAATALSKLPREKNGLPSVSSIRSVLDEHLTTSARKLLDSKRSDAPLVEILRKWWLWETQREWLSNGQLTYGTYEDFYAGSPSYDNRARSSRRLGGNSTPPNQEDTENLINVSRLAVSRSLAEAKQVIDVSRGAVQQRVTSTAAMPSELQIGGVKVGLTQALELSLPFITLLMLLFVIFFCKAEIAIRHGRAWRNAGDGASRAFWFPRLGSPLDPFASPVPRSLDEWLTRFFWLTFLALPVLFGFFSAWGGMLIENFFEADTRFGDHRAINWIQTFLFLATWVAVLRVTRRETPRKASWIPLLVYAMTAVILLFTLGGAYWAAKLGISVASGHIIRCLEGVSGLPYCPDTTWEAVMALLMYPTYWLGVLLWLTVALQSRRVSRFCMIFATLITISMMPSLGEALLTVWTTGLGP